MSTNYRQVKQDDSSDDEGPSKRVKHDDDEGEGSMPVRPPQAPAAPSGSKKGNTLWAEVVQEEELSIRSSGMDMTDCRRKGGSFVRIRRGAESYVVPAAKLEENAAALEAGEDIEKDLQLPRAAPSDDPFGDSSADLGEVEAFGVGPSSGRGGSGSRGGWQPRGGGGGRGGRGMRGGWMKRGDHHQGGCGGAPRPEAKAAAGGGDEEMMEQGEGGDAPSAEGGGHRGGRGGRGGGRGQRGFVPRGRGNWRGGASSSSVDDGRKRRWNDGNFHGHAHAKNPEVLMDKGYSLAGLLATEFQEGLSVQELGDAISKALGERESDTVAKIVVAVGEQKALELFEATKKAEQEGGVKVADGSRRRTPGGVFILLFKSDADVDPSVKDSIFAESMAAARKFAKARKRKTNVGRDLDELQAMLEAKKRELEKDGKKDSPEEGEATPSPANNDGEEELDYTEEDDDSTPSPEEGTEME